MRINRKTPPQRYTDERAALVAKMQRAANRDDTHWQAQAAVAGDPVLSNRLTLAAARGMAPVVLAGLARHRHAQTVEEALDAFETSTAGGPCAACGSARGRVGLGPFGYLDNPIPGFSPNRDGNTYCLACADVIREHGTRTLRVRAFLAAAGCTSPGLEDPPGVTFAHEVPHLGDGTPWSHVDRAEARAVAVRRFHPRSFCVTPGAAEHASMPGLPPYVWAGNDLPRPQVQFMPPSAKSDAADREWAATQARTAEQRSREQTRLARHHAQLREADERFAAMTPTEQQAEMDKREHWAAMEATSGRR